MDKLITAIVRENIRNRQKQITIPFSASEIRAGDKVQIIKVVDAIDEHNEDIIEIKEAPPPKRVLFPGLRFKKEVNSD